MNKEIISEEAKIVSGGRDNGPDSTAIEIFMAFDDGFVQHACVGMASVLSHSRAEINFNILSSNLSPKSKAKLDDLKRIRSFNLYFLQVDPELFSGITLRIKRISIATYFRLAIPFLCPYLKKAIYLDADLIVRESIKKLWDTDISDVYAGVVEDLMPREQIHFPNECYFNAGVLLLNLERIRQDFSLGAFAEMENAHHDVFKYQDQDVLNMAFGRRVAYLERSWNVGAPYFMELPEEHKKVALEIADAAQSPRILHFTGVNKPWINPAGEFPDAYVLEYFHYLKMAGFPKEVSRIFCNYRRRVPIALMVEVLRLLKRWILRRGRFSFLGQTFRLIGRFSADWQRVSELKRKAGKVNIN